MSMPSEDQDRKTPPGEDTSRSDQGRRRGLDPEDETLLGKPVSRHDQMTQVAIAGFLGLLLVTFAIGQSAPEVPVAPDPVPIDVPLLIEPVVVEEIVLLPPPVPEPVAPLALANNRLYGTVVTRRGERFEGYIRWDRNEGSWADLLDASKRYSRLRARDNGDRAERRLRIRGVRISWRDNDLSSSVTSGIRFGHIRRIEVLDRRSALFELKSGEEMELRGNATDLGSSLRRLIVTGPDGEEEHFRWSDLDLIEFESAPEGQAPGEERLFGTLITRSGAEFTGYVAWDVDEIYSTDILDGDQDGREREIQFGDIELIERYSSRAARVVLDDGEEMILRGTNDVDGRNSGISISDQRLGQIKVDWDEFDQLRFHPAESHLGYDGFDGGRLLYGTLTTLDGSELTGEIRWDNDEAYTWEMLNGEADGADFDIEFGQIESIEHRSHRGATVTLLDGRVFQLSGSNDVDDGNRGIYLSDEDGDLTVVDWSDFEGIRFHSPR